MAGFPSGEPSWQVSDLEQLAANNQLYGINPLVLSGVAQNESGWEVAGPGINAEGYGGFFGLGENSTYSYAGSSFTDTPQELEDPSSGSFEEQAITAAAEIASLISSSGGNLEQALIEYTGGSPTDYDDVAALLGNQPGYGADTTNPQTGSGADTTQATLESANQASSSSPVTVQQSGIAGVLQDLDAFLNPSKSGSSVPIIGSFLNVGSDVEDTVLLVVGRGILTIFFLGVVIGGVYLLVRKPVTAARTLINPLQAQQRIGNESRRLDISEQRLASSQGLGQ
jgi:hypothetical protein